MRVNPFNVQLNNSQKLRPCGPKQNDISFGMASAVADELIMAAVKAADTLGTKKVQLADRAVREVNPQDGLDVIQTLLKNASNRVIVLSENAQELIKGMKGSFERKLNKVS